MAVAQMSVLLLFTWLGTQQCYCWYTFGSLVDSLDYFGFDTEASRERFADLALDWGALGFVLSLPLAVWVLRRYGLRWNMRACAMLTFACCLLRIVPCVFVASPSARASWVWLLHASCALNAIAGSFYACAVTTLSAEWFLPGQRTTATAVGYMGGNLGMCIGYALGAFFSRPSGGLFGCAQMPSLLFTELGLALPALLLVWPLPASAPALGDGAPAALAAALDAPRSEASPPVTPARFASEVRAAICQPSLVFLVLASGGYAGANAAWGGLLPQIFASRRSWDTAEAQRVANDCGFLNVGGSVFGMVLAGLLADKCFRRRLKEMVIFCFVASAFITALVTVQFATPWQPSSALWAAPEGVVGTTLFAAGVLSGMLDPLCLELAAEVGFPTSEATSSGLLTLVYNAAALAVLSLQPILRAVWVNTGYTAVFVLCTLLMLGVRSRYGRSDSAAEESRAAARAAAAEEAGGRKRSASNGADVALLSAAAADGGFGETQA